MLLKQNLHFLEGLNSNELFFIQAYLLLEHSLYWVIRKTIFIDDLYQILGTQRLADDMLRIAKNTKCNLNNRKLI